MKQIIIVLLLLLFKIGIVFSQERYYFEIPKKTKAKYEIKLSNSVLYNTDTLNFKIESLVLLKPKKSWHINYLSLLNVVNDRIYAKDNNSNLLLFDINGNPIRKVDLSKIDKNFKITDNDIYNDTLYLVDNKSLFLIKYTTKGEFISNHTLIFNFEDFKISKEGIYFISKNIDEKRKKGIRICLFDFSLNIQQQYFVTDGWNKSVLRPKFFTGDENEFLFSVTKGNRIYSLEKNKETLYLKVYGEDYISDYSYILGFHKIGEGYDVDRSSYDLVNSYYFPYDNI